MESIDRLRTDTFKMYKSLYPMSMIFNRLEKKLIYTLLYDITKVCEISAYITVGYRENEEIEARLDEIHRYFYRIDEINDHNCSTVSVQLDIIRYLLKNEKIWDIAEKLQKLYETDLIGNMDCNNLICIDSFREKDDKHMKRMRRKCLSEKELRKILKKIKHNRSN